MDEKHGTVHLEEIGQIALTVADLEESKTFYRDVLGMKFLFDAGTMAFFQCGSVRLLIGAADPGTEKPAAETNKTILYFRVRDIESVNGQLILTLPSGIPSHDTFNRVLAALDPEEMEKGFVAWVSSIAKLTAGEVVPSMARPCVARAKEERRPWCTWFRPGPRVTDWCWRSAKSMKNPTKSRPFPVAQRAGLTGTVVTLTPWAASAGSLARSSRRRPTMYWQSRRIRVF